MLIETAAWNDQSGSMYSDAIMSNLWSLWYCLRVRIKVKVRGVQNKKLLNSHYKVNYKIVIN